MGTGENLYLKLKCCIFPTYFKIFFFSLQFSYSITWTVVEFFFCLFLMFYVSTINSIFKIIPVHVFVLEFVCAALEINFPACFALRSYVQVT